MPTYVLNRRETIVEQWGRVVDHGAGKDTWMMDAIEGMMKDADMPGVTCRQMEVSATTVFGRKRDFLLVTFTNLKDYRMFIGARDVGTYLSVSWFLTIAPGFLKRTISKRTFGDPQALSMHIPIFDQQDLSVYIGVAHHCVTETVQKLMKELEQDPTGLNTKSKGFLELW